MHTHTCTHTRTCAYDIIGNSQGFPQWGLQFAIEIIMFNVYMCMRVRACMHVIVHMCGGTPQHIHPSPTPQSCREPVQGLSVLFAGVGSGDPVRVLRLYTTNTLDVLLKHLLLRHMYNLPLPVLMCYAQALRSETSYCYCRSNSELADCLTGTPSNCCSCTVLCGALYTACVDTSRMVFWDCSVLR